MSKSFLACLWSFTFSVLLMSGYRYCHLVVNSILNAIFFSFFPLISPSVNSISGRCATKLKHHAVTSWSWPRPLMTASPLTSAVKRRRRPGPLLWCHHSARPIEVRHTVVLHLSLSSGCRSLKYKTTSANLDYVSHKLRVWRWHFTEVHPKYQNVNFFCWNI